MEKLHPKAVWLFFWHFFFMGLFLVFFVLIFLSQITILLVNELGWGWGWGFLIALLIIFIYVVLCYILARLSYRYWRYELTENAVKIEKGIISKRYISIPYERIQNVDIYRGLLARILGLSDLHIQTAGYSGGYSGGLLFGARRGSTEGRLPGLDPQIAEQLREQLVQKVKSTKQGL